ncbi:hypothetical protein [Lacipirellula sp.]|uniref:hypothetical protein n=1 Tax=Lacipirellula sp. TaxID=2691419 RepID=UPI003D0E6DA7
MSQGFSSDLTKGTPRTACNALRRFEWTDEYQQMANAEASSFSCVFSLADIDPIEIRRLIEDYNRLQYQPLNEAEEDAFVAREMCVRGADQNADRFSLLTGLAYQFVTHLKEAGELQRLGRLADLPPSGEIEHQTNLPFLTPAVPPAESFRLVAYQNQLGHPLVLGARLLWWCAAAHNQGGGFEHSAINVVGLRQHPIWITYVGSRFAFDSPPFCRLEGYPLRVMKDAAGFLLDHAETKPTQVAEVPKNAGPQQDGFDDSGVFWRNGRTVNGDLSKQSLDVLTILFSSNSLTMRRDEFCKKLFETDDKVPDKTLEAALRRFTTRCRAKHKMLAREKSGWVILELL